MLKNEDERLRLFKKIDKSLLTLIYLFLAVNIHYLCFSTGS